VMNPITHAQREKKWGAARACVRRTGVYELVKSETAITQNDGLGWAQDGGAVGGRAYW